jgi:fatty-acyl-CoA synthase
VRRFLSHDGLCSAFTVISLRTARYFPKKEIVSVYPEGVFRYTYGDYYKRVCQLAHALQALGIKRGDKVASMALNDHRHLELYFGVPCSGAVLHTVNFRLPPHHMAYIINHAEDRVLFVDEDLLIFVELIKDQIPGIEKIVVLSHTGKLPPDEPAERGALRRPHQGLPRRVRLPRLT